LPQAKEINMEPGNLVKYEDNYGAQLGIVLYMDTDNYQDPIFKVLWDDGSTSLEHPTNSCIEVIQ
tara:strand:- start:580 stop:774 length:195 start_codon:yes stop_codon:yes gene_type:complete